jgi:hypothetical protein
MSGYVPLPDDEVRKNAEAFYNKKTGITTEQTNPKAIFVAGQPGAVKSRAMEN